MPDSRDSVLKLYCYVDETGQDTKGRLFIVAVAVIVGPDRESLRDSLRCAESFSRKGPKKWSKSNLDQKRAYLTPIITNRLLENTLYFRAFEGVTNYHECVLSTIAAAIAAVTVGRPYRATILIDGLGKTERHLIGRGLHNRRVRTEKIRGLRDESDELIRLVDSVAGLTRSHLDRLPWATELFQTAQANGILRQVNLRSEEPESAQPEQ
jgi:hypothetical protein